MEPYYYRSLKELELIRENPDVLLQFMDHIDGGSPGLLRKIGNFFPKRRILDV